MATTILIMISIFTSLADSLFNAGHYELARIEYKREFYFHPELKDEREKRLNYALSLCYSDHEITYFELHRYVSDFVPLSPQERKTLAGGYVYLGDHYTAKGLLAGTEEHRLLAYTEILEHEWEKARRILLRNDEVMLSGIIDRYLSTQTKKAGTAMLLSAFCPGAGEIYCGDLKTGFKALLVNVGTGFLLYNAISKKKYVDAALIFNFLFQRFYFGSIFNAKRLALEYNERLESQYINEFAEQIHFKYLAPRD